MKDFIVSLFSNQSGTAERINPLMLSQNYFSSSLGFLMAALLSACGGGGGSSDNSFTGGAADWQPNVFKDADQFADRCVNPRAGYSPITGLAYPDATGNFRDENNFLRSWTNDTYLWYDEVTDRNPSSYPDPLAYFDLLKTNQQTASGTPKDQFHFTYDSDDWDALSQSGITYGYGMELVWVSDMEIRVAYTEPGSPAALSNIPRGAKIISVDGVDVQSNLSEADYYVVIDGLYPAVIGETHEIKFQKNGATTIDTVVLQSASVVTAPVQNVRTIDTASGKVGYLLFNDHSAPSEQELIDAINQLTAANVTDVVLDLRYNGGGYLDIASELAYMIAGDQSTQGKVFEQLEFNDKYPNQNPVTGESLQPVPFHRSTQGFTNSAVQALPSLNLDRVFVLTGSNTCSASESLINGLRGVDVEVIQIGRTTCGKPYGFYPTPNCGTTYFTVQFRGVNAKGFGDYSDGFVPSSMDNHGDKIRGCSLADDFTHELGDPAETRLAAALHYRQFDVCPSAAINTLVQKTANEQESKDGASKKVLGLQNKLLRLPNP